MTSRLKPILGFLAVVAAIGALLWMRSLAYWRPQRVMVLPKNYEPFHLSEDGRFLTAQKLSFTSRIFIGNELYDFKTFDLQTGKSYNWPNLPSMQIDPQPAFGWTNTFYWQFNKRSRKAGALRVLGLQDPVSRQTKTTLPYKKGDPPLSTTISILGNAVRILDEHALQEFDLTSDHLVRKVTWQMPFVPSSRIGWPMYALSPDSKLAYGYQGRMGKVWNAHDGHLIKHWKVTGAELAPIAFSPDATLIVYLDSAAPNATNWIFVDSATGVIKSVQKFDLYVLPRFCGNGHDIVVPQQNNCEIRNAATSQVVRLLPGPRLADLNSCLVTPNWIYTLNDKGEILRWRAR